MKKFMGIILIVVVIAMIGSVVSFFVFDFAGIIEAQTRRHRGIGHRVAEETGELVGDILGTIAESISDSIDITVEASIDGMIGGKAPKERLGKIIEDALNASFDKKNGDLGWKKTVSDIFPNVLNEIGIKDGYITEEDIHKGRDLVVEQWTETSEAYNIKLNGDNLNVVVGATKGEEIAYYLTKHELAPYELNVKKEWKDKDYYLTTREKSKVSKKRLDFGNHTLFILLPDQYQGELTLDMENGNIILIRQRNQITIEMKNGNIIANQVENHNFDAKLTNGNIIVKLVDDLNAEVTMQIERGKAIGFGAGAFLSGTNGVHSKEIFGEGKYQIHFEITNGILIGH